MIPLSLQLANIKLTTSAQQNSIYET